MIIRDEIRDEMIRKLAQYWTDAVELDALKNYFYEQQEAHLETVTDEELQEFYNEYFVE